MDKKVQCALNLQKRVTVISLFLDVLGSESLLAGGERDSGTSGVTGLTCNGSVGQKTSLFTHFHLWCLLKHQILL